MYSLTACRVSFELRRDAVVIVIVFGSRDSVGGICGGGGGHIGWYCGRWSGSRRRSSTPRESRIVAYSHHCWTTFLYEVDDVGYLVEIDALRSITCGGNCLSYIINTLYNVYYTL